MVRSRIDADRFGVASAGALDCRDLKRLRSSDPGLDLAGAHHFAVTVEVAGEELTTLTGDVVTKVFERPFSNSPDWQEKPGDLANAPGRDPKQIWFLYTTCPKCAKA